MPKKSKTKKKSGGKGKGKGGEKAAAKAAAAAEAEEMLKTCKKFIKSYQVQCSATGSIPSQRILRDLRTCVENERPLPKFILDLQEPVWKKTTTSDASKKPPRDTSDSNPKSANLSQQPEPRPSTTKEEGRQIETLTIDVATTTTGSVEMHTCSSSTAGPRLEPLVNVWKELNYHSLRCLHIWNLVQPDEAVVSLALFVESKLGPNLKVLELRDCRLSVWAIGRLARSLGNSQIAVLNLDYNRCVHLAMGNLCMGVQRCTSLHSLSLNYCHLDSSAAEPLGSLTATSSIKHLSLTGNNLHCDGASELITALVSVCEGGSEQQLKPPLSRLHLQDNGIDILGSKGMVESISFARLLKRWLLSSEVIEDINLADNWIGDASGRELSLALQERKDAGLPAIRLTVTHRISPDIFTSIVELGTPSKKKGGKKKGKKKKK